ncbi:MAG: MFS transporter [Coriobacteriales bacterium]|jgi:OFA family oxalate/formate antiporter-like MFS transporter|nr:MFS transporter [Coriobacteriales bacterium]
MSSPSSRLSLSQIKARRLTYLVFATITLLVLGLIYAWSIFATPIGKQFPAYKGLLSQVFQVSMFVFCLIAIPGSQIVKRVSAKVAIVVAALLLAVGFIATPLTAGLGAWALFLFYGVFAAAGCGIAYNAIIALVNPWWPDKVGLCSGVQMMGFGVSSLVFGSAANALFPLIGWQTVCYIVAVLGFVLMLLLAVLVKPAPADIASRLGLAGAASATTATATQRQNILSAKTFWFYFIWATVLVTCGLAVIPTASQGAQAMGADAGFGALLVGLVSTMNGLARIINGALFDRIGLTPVMVIGAIVSIVTMAGSALAFALHLAPCYVVCAILVAFSYGGVPVMASAFARARFDAADFAKNLSIANCVIAVAALLNIILTALLGSAAGANAALVFAILAVLAVLALLVVLPFAKIYKSDLARIAEEME